MPAAGELSPSTTLPGTNNILIVIRRTNTFQDPPGIGDTRRQVKKMPGSRSSGHEESRQTGPRSGENVPSSVRFSVLCTLQEHILDVLYSHILNIQSSGQGVIPDRRYSPRTLWRTIWCNSKTDSIVWMKEDVYRFFWLRIKKALKLSFSSGLFLVYRFLSLRNPINPKEDIIYDNPKTTFPYR